MCDVCAREMCVSEDWEDRREEEKEGVDTALKTKTPHVNVGKYSFIYIFKEKERACCSNPAYGQEYCTASQEIVMWKIIISLPKEV